MQFTTIITIFFCCTSLLVNQASGGYVILQVLLNNGNDSFHCVDRWNNCCTSSEWNFISQKVYTMSQNQRDLSVSNSTVKSDDVSLVDDYNTTHTDRDLKTYPRYCANSCKGIAAGRCMALNCKKYRQRRTSLRPKRDLFYSTSCDNQKSEMNNLLTNIQNQLSPQCRSLLNAPRKMTCFNADQC